MQLGSSTIPLVPAVGVGAAAVLVAVVLWGVYRARSASREPVPSVAPRRDVAPLPVAEDWTGEGAAGAADPPAAPRRATVADAVAARLADTGPLPVVERPRPAAAHSRGPADIVRAGARDGSVAAVPTAGGPSGSGARAVGVAPAEAVTAGPSAAGPRAAVDGAAGTGAAYARPDDASATAALVSPPEAATGRTAIPRTDRAEPATGTPTGDAAADGRPSNDDLPPDRTPVAPSPVPPPWSAARSDPDTTSAPAPDLDGADDPRHVTPVHGAEPVSRAVRQALAARAVQRARRHDDVDDAPPAAPTRPEPPADDRRQADARDRLLAVLLDDPARALGATVELDETRDRIEQIGGALRRRRSDLGVAVRHLHDAGLSDGQIERLSGLDGDHVRELLGQVAGQDAGENR